MSRPRVLIIDDAPGVGRSIGLMIEGICDAECAATAGAALDLLGAGARFDAVLCDLNLPDMPAGQLVMQLAAHWPELAERVVLITGGTFDDADASIQGVPSERRLQKPFGVDALLMALAEVRALPRVE